MKNFLYSKFGLNLARSSILLNYFGFSNKKGKNIKNNIYIENIFNLFLLKNLEKKDFILKKNYNLVFKKIENGSYKGYKFSRGLPIYNQRTKTNSKTARINNNNFLNVYL